MGVLDTLGVGGVFGGSLPSAGTVWGYLGTFAGLTGLFLVSVIIFLIVIYIISQKNKYIISLHWFQAIHGKMIPMMDEKAEELTIPGTTIRVFKTKKGKYLPAGVDPMGKNSYWIAKTRTGENIYFTVTDINKDMKEAGLDYDHSDARAQNENLRDLISKAYTQKSQKWWQEYKEVISLAILIFVFSLATIFVLGKAQKVISTTQPVLDLNAQVLEEVKKTLIVMDNLCGKSIGLAGISESGGSEGEVSVGSLPTGGT